MDDDRILQMLRHQAWKTSAWAILQGSLDHQAARSASFDHLFRLGWPAVYVLYRRAHGMAPDEASTALQALFAQVASGSSRRAAGVRFRTFLRTAARDQALGHRPPSVTVAAPPAWGAIVQASIPDVEARASAPAAEESPDELFDRELALGVARLALEDFHATCERAQVPAWAEAVRLRYDAVGARPSLPRLADLLELREEETTRVLYKARQAVQRAAVAVVRSTLPPEEVDSPEAARAELAHLCRALRGEVHDATADADRAILPP